MRKCVCEERQTPAGTCSSVCDVTKVTGWGIRNSEQHVWQELHRLKPEGKTWLQKTPQKKKKYFSVEAKIWLGDSFASCLRETGSRSSSHSSPLVSNRAQGAPGPDCCATVWKASSADKKETREVFVLSKMKRPHFFFLSGPQIEQLQETSLILNGCGGVSLSRLVLSGQERLQSKEFIKKIVST